MATTSTTESWRTSMPDTSGLEKVRSQLTDLYNTIGQAYTDLNNAGRESEAAQLREAADRFAKIGSQYGANAFVRQAALQDLSNKFRIAGQVTESSNMTKKIGEQLGVLSALANVTQNTFASAMERAKMVQTGDQQEAQNAIQRMQINASLEAQARNRAATSQNAMRQQSIAAQAQNRGMPAAPAVDPFRRAEASNFTANLNATNRFNSGAMGAGIGGWTQTGGFSGAPAGGTSPGSLPWYTGPITGEKATPAAIAGETPYTPPGSTGGTTGGAVQPPGATAEAKSTPVRIDVDPITGKRTITNQPIPVVSPVTPATVAKKKGSAAAERPTSPLFQAGEYAKNIWNSPLNPISQGAKNAVKTINTVANIPNWLTGVK